MLTEQQVQNRRNGIGASEAAIVMGLSPHTSAYKLWMIKTGKMEADDISEVPCVHWGNVHEETIAQEYASRTGVKVHPVPETLYHKDYPFILCHLDRKVEGVDKLLECKFSMFAGDRWGESGSDHVPQSYIIQVQHQLAVTGYPEGDLAVLIGGYDFRIYHIKRDEVLIAAIIKQLSEFWECVKNDTPPPIRDFEDAKLAWPYEEPGKVKEADTELMKIVDSLKEVKATVKKIAKEKESLETKVRSYMGKAECLIMGDAILATWKSNAGGSRRLEIKGA